MRYLPPIFLLCAGLIHLLAISGVLGSQALSKLYSIQIQDLNLEILLRHRAVTFGVLGSWLIAAGLFPALRPAAYVGGLVSAASFIAIARLVGNYNAAIARIVIADVVATVLLLLAVAVELILVRSLSETRGTH